MTERQQRSGVAMALAAFTLWGLMPLYWHALQPVPSLQIAAHRVVWSAVLVGTGLLLAQGRRWLPATLANARTARLLGLSSLLIGANWVLYIWAVNAGHVVETALGYYINPILNVALGVVVLGERLRRLQWAAVGLAVLGVLWLTFRHGAFPWIALALAGSFALYSLVRKFTTADAVAGFAVESLFLLVPAAVFLVLVELRGGGGFLRPAPAGFGGGASLLLVASGIVTSFPLIAFAHALRRVPLSLIGLMQYLAPTLQFLVGVLVFKESFDANRAVGFACIWISLALVAGDGLRQSRRNEAAAPKGAEPAA
jgi:chloramphenicol-sensitive protein RarD